MEKKTRIAYMGTPEFAVTPLKHLYESGYNIVCVVTMPDKPIGRGQKMGESAVKKYAESVGLTILQPEKLKDEEFLDSLRALDIDLGIVVAFRMLPEVVWSMPRFGTFNLHSSLLPDYRGAAPINWALINGDIVSGVTTFMLDHKIDTGAIIDRIEVAIEESDNCGTLHDKLMNVGAELVEESIKQIVGGSLKLKPQIEDGKMRPAPKIFKEDCKIDWNNDCRTIFNFVRGLSPYPAAWSDFDGAYGDAFSMKIFGISYEITNHERAMGEVVTDNRTFVKVACRDGYVAINDIQMAGKKRMNVASFLCGNKM